MTDAGRTRRDAHPHRAASAGRWGAAAAAAGMVIAFAATAGSAAAAPTIVGSEVNARATIPPGATRALTVNCPNRGNALFGYVVPEGDPDLQVLDQGPVTPSRWRAQVRNVGASAKRVKLGAICHRGVDGLAISAAGIGQSANALSSLDTGGGTSRLADRPPREYRLFGVTRDRVGDIDAGDEDGERIKCPPGQVVSTLWLTGGNGSVYITSVRIIGSGSGRELRIGMLNPSRFDAEGVVIKFRCKTAKRGVTLTVEKGGRSPRKAEVVQRHATLSRKLSGVRRDVKVAAATGTIQLRCFSHSNSVIEAGYVFRGSGTVLSSGPLPDGTGWRARVTGTKAGDVVGMHIICAQPGPLLRARWQG